MLKIARFLYAMLVFSIPFNGLVRILPAGEFSGDGFFYASIPFNALITILVISRKSIPSNFSRHYLKYIFIIFILFLIPSLWNMYYIIGAKTSLRSGFFKFIASYGALAYYGYTFLCVAILASLIGIESFMKRTSRYFLFSGGFMIIVSAIEIVGWYSEPVRGALIAFRSLFAELPERVQFRLSGVSFEPSFFSIAMLTAIPWGLFYFKRYRSPAALFIVVLLIVCCALSGARTAYVGLLALIPMWIISRKRRPIYAYVAASLPVVMMTLGLIVPLIAYSMLGSFSNVSNITRTFLASRAVMTGIDHPFGVGFGQVSFYLLEQMNSYIKLSWELEAWHSGDRAGQLTPIYSWYGRTVGEIGIILYCISAVVLSFYMYNFFLKGLRHRRSEIAYNILQMSLMYMGLFFAVGFSSDSYKFMPFWFMILLMSIFSSQRFISHRLRRPHVNRAEESPRREPAFPGNI